MKRIHVFILSLVIVVITSCSLVEPSRRVVVTIPTHPWEIASGQRLWYTLKWTDGKGLSSLYVSPEEREVPLDVPVGQTVLIAAYPLGDMHPFGGAVTPLDPYGRITLSQNDGVLVSELMDIDVGVTGRLNYDRLRSDMAERVEDFREVDLFSILRDLQNGELSQDSIRKVERFGIDSFSLPNGIWTSESIRDPSFVVEENMTCPMQLSEGVFRYLNPEMERVLVLVVDSRGDFYTYMRQFLL